MKEVWLARKRGVLVEVFKFLLCSVNGALAASKLVRLRI